MEARLIVETALAELLTLETRKAALEAPFKGQIQALQGTIAVKVGQIEEEMDNATYIVDMEIAHQIKLIEAHGVEVGKTVKVQGEQGSISSVYYEPNYTIDKKKFAGFAVSHPEAWQITEAVPAKVQIRRGK
jgi:hypothetical protein